MGQADVPDLDAIARLLELADFTIPFAVRAVSTLCLADHLSGGPLSVGELARASGAHPDAIRRLLLDLVATGLFSGIEADRVALTPISDLLRTDHPLSLSDAYRLVPLEVRAWSALEHSLRTGRSAFESVYGEDHRSYRGAHPEEDARMDRAHRAATRIEAQVLMRLYDWTGVRRVVDVGGGTGAFLAALLGSFKSMRGVLFDLPRMVARAGDFLAEAGVADRCEIVGGDFFESAPAGGDVYILKAVLGGWDDQSAVRILSNVRAAMPAHARLLVLEPILGYGKDFSVGNVVQLQSLMLYGGPDRQLEDYQRIFDSAGLQVSNIIRRATLPIIELQPL